MRVVLTRVKHASVSVGGQQVGKIDQGLLALCGFDEHDKSRDLRWTLEKMAKLRIFSDAAGKMNLSANDLGCPLLLVSQFTLFAEVLKGNRPSFTKAAGPAKAQALYEEAIAIAREYFSQVETGIFAADMQVESMNDGPVTILIDSRDKYPL